MNHLYLHLESTKFLHLPIPSLLYDRQKPWWQQILDPNGEFVNKWNRIFLGTSLIALFIDPLFFFLPKLQTDCMEIDVSLAVVLMALRTIVDLFSVLLIAMKFRTSYVAPSSRIFGRGELVLDPRRIAFRYLKTDFVIDLTAALPIPQVSGSWILFISFLSILVARTCPIVSSMKGGYVTISSLSRSLFLSVSPTFEMFAKTIFVSALYTCSRQQSQCGLLSTGIGHASNPKRREG